MNIYKFLIYIFFIAYCLLPTVNCFANQQSSIDSLKKVIAVANHDTTKVILLNDLSKKYRITNFKMAEQYAGKALKLAKKIHFKKGIAKSLSNIGIIYEYQGDFAKALNYFKKALKIREEIGYKKGISRSLISIGIMYEYQGNYEKALEHYLKSLKINEELNDKSEIGLSLSNIGVFYFSQQNYEKSLEYHLQSLKIFEELKNKQGIAGSLNNIALVYFTQNNSEKALDYFFKALKIKKELGEKMGISMILNNIGGIYYGQGKYKISLEYNLQSLKIREELGDKKGIAGSLTNIGFLHSLQGNYKDAIKYCKKSLTIAKEINSKYDIMQAYECLSETYFMQNHYKKAYEYYQLYYQTKDSLFNEESHKQIAEMQTKYETEKKEKEIILLNKEKEVKDLELTKRQAEIKKQRILIYSSISGFIIILIFSVLLYRQFDQKKKANILLAQQNVEINQQKEEITVQRDEISAQRDEIKIQRDLATKQRDQITVQKGEITDSILYAKHIQSAILPPDEYINKILPEYFILNKPRDIVSGDFYWMMQKENKTIVAAVDCTGHGVPGAFMSMLGISSLNEITSSNISLQANVILNKLREYVMKSLHQTGKKEEAKDGMDIALCILDLKTNQLQYSGANNPLYIIRNNEKSSLKKGGVLAGGSQGDVFPKIINLPELIEIKADLSAVTEGAKNEKHILYEVKADRMPIGIQIVEKIADLPSFTNHKIKLSKGDTIYMFSDGFVDQFGGPNGKKFKSKQFKQLLIDIQKKNMTEQKDILDKTIEDWKGDLEQVDDILVMGIRI